MDTIANCIRAKRKFDDESVKISYPLTSSAPPVMSTVSPLTSETISISQLSPEDYEWFTPRWTKPKHCYHNCFLATYSSHLRAKKNPETWYRYVLCTLTLKSENIPVEHALIERDGKFYDPTLQATPLQAEAHYKLVKIFSHKELLEHIATLGPDVEEMKRQSMPWPCLVQLRPQEFGFDVNAESE